MSFIEKLSTPTRKFLQERISPETLQEFGLFPTIPAIMDSDIKEAESIDKKMDLLLSAFDNVTRRLSSLEEKKSGEKKKKLIVEEEEEQHNEEEEEEEMLNAFSSLKIDEEERDKKLDSHLRYEKRFLKDLEANLDGLSKEEIRKKIKERIRLIDLVALHGWKLILAAQEAKEGKTEKEEEFLARGRELLKDRAASNKKKSAPKKSNKGKSKPASGGTPPKKEGSKPKKV